MAKIGYFIFILFSSTLLADNSRRFYSEIRAATELADLEQVKKFLKEGANINANEFSDTLLCEAYIKWGAAEKKEEFKKAGTYRQMILPGMTGEAEVSAEKYRSFVEGLYLLGAKPDISYQNHTCLQTLIVAYPKFDNQILHLIHNKADINLPDPEGNSPLHLAAKVGNEKVVLELTQLKADLNKRNKKGNTAADVAILSFNSPVADLIKSKGGTFSKDISELYKIRKRGKNDVEMGDIKVTPDSSVTMAGRSGTDFQIGQKLLLTVTWKGEPQAITFNLVDEKNVPLPTEIKKVNQFRSEESLYVSYRFVVPQKPFRYWVSAKNLDGAIAKNMVDPKINVPAKYDAKVANPYGVKNPDDTVSMMLSQTYKLAVNVNPFPSKKDLEALYGKWAASYDPKFDFEAQRKGGRPKPRKATSPAEILFELGPNKCKVSMSEKCEARIENGGITIEESKSRGGLPGARIGVIVSDVGFFVMSRESFAVPLVPVE